MKTIDSKLAWQPCNAFNEKTGEILEKGWIEAFFGGGSIQASAVVIHFASDGKFSSSAANETIAITLIDDEKKYVKMNNGNSVEVNCASNPSIVSLNNNKNNKNNNVRVLGVRIDFQIGFIAIAGIALRSLQAKQCRANEVYNKQSKKCEQLKDDVLKCPKLELNNADITCSRNGQTCLIRCKKGYHAKNKDKSTAWCDHGTWRNSEDCVIKDCGVPKIENGVLSK